MLNAKFRQILFWTSVMGFLLLLVSGVTLLEYFKEIDTENIINCFSCSNNWETLIQTIVDFGFGLAALLFIFAIAFRWARKKLQSE